MPRYSQWRDKDGADRMTEQFISKKANPEAKIEMHRCRLVAEFLHPSSSQRLSPAASSADVCNSRHNDVGALELHEMSDPRASCTRGGFKVLLSSEFKAPTLKKAQQQQEEGGADKKGGNGQHPIHAVFVLPAGEGGEWAHADAVCPGFNQVRISPKIIIPYVYFYIIASVASHIYLLFESTGCYFSYVF